MKGDCKIRTEKPKTVSVYLRISEELKEKFKEALIKNDESQSDILRSCIKKYVEKSK